MQVGSELEVVSEPTPKWFSIVSRRVIATWIWFCLVEFQFLKV
jgi:hypothetical protein